MDFALKINLDNSAFDAESIGRDALAVAKILEAVAARLAACGSLERADSGQCFDVNGNRVGVWFVARDAKITADV